MCVTYLKNQTWNQENIKWTHIIKYELWPVFFIKDGQVCEIDLEWVNVVKEVLSGHNLQINFDLLLHLWHKAMNLKHSL